MSRQAPGKTRHELAKLLSKESGALFEAHRIQENNHGYARHFDHCRWDSWGIFPGGARLHVYSWDTMKDCVKFGIKFLKSGPNDWEVSTK